MGATERLAKLYKPGEWQVDRQERAKELEEAIAGAVADLEARMLEGRSEDFLNSLEWWSRFHSYSWNNSILILLQRPEAIQVAGYKAWEKLGYHVRKGEKGIFIRGPILKKMTDEDTGEITERLVGYMPLAVFDISQTAEYPDKQPPSPYQPETTADWEHLYECWSRRLTTLYDIPVKEMDMGGLTFGMTNGKSIRLNSRQEVSIKAQTLLHETAHLVAGHASKEGHERWSRQEREAQVEAASFVLCRMLGADHPNAANYLLNYRVEPGKLSDHLETIGQIVRDVRHMLAFKDLAKEVQLAADTEVEAA